MKMKVIWRERMVHCSFRDRTRRQMGFDVVLRLRAHYPRRHHFGGLRSGYGLDEAGHGRVARRHERGEGDSQELAIVQL